MLSVSFNTISIPANNKCMKVESQLSSNFVYYLGTNSAILSTNAFLLDTTEVFGEPTCKLSLSYRLELYNSKNNLVSHSTFLAIISQDKTNVNLTISDSPLILVGNYTIKVIGY